MEINKVKILKILLVYMIYLKLYHLMKYMIFLCKEKKRSFQFLTKKRIDERLEKLKVTRSEQRLMWDSDTGKLEKQMDLKDCQVK